MRLPAVAFALLLSPPAASPGQTAGEIQACMERNAPSRSASQLLEFTAVDRVGGERVSRAKVLAKKLDDGLRRLRLRFVRPIDLRGSALLIIETGADANDMFLYTPELRKTKRVTADAASGSLFGTDFSYEDFERWQGLNRPGRTERRPDAVVAERPCHVLETLPAADSSSAYESIVSYVDRETCVVLRSESFEAGGRLRKVLTVDPSSVVTEAGLHMATDVVMRDLRDETHTRVVVEDLEVDRELSDREFLVSRLGRSR